jgi:hypothetical protein
MAWDDMVFQAGGVADRNEFDRALAGQHGRKHCKIDNVTEKENQHHTQHFYGSM